MPWPPRSAARQLTRPASAVVSPASAYRHPLHRRGNRRRAGRTPSPSASPCQRQGLPCRARLPPARAHRPPTCFAAPPPLVEDGKSGYLFEPGNADDLAAKMWRYISNPALAVRHGAWNRNRRHDFDEVRTLDRLQQLYSEDVPPASPATDVVICAGDCPNEIALLLQRFHAIEKGRFQVRFIWHEWADAAVWRQARLLWLWSGRPPLPSLTRALGKGLPVLAPAGSIAQQFAHQSPIVIGYGSYLEALAAIAGIMDAPRGYWSRDQRAPDLARFMASIAPRDSFHLPTGALA